MHNPIYKIVTQSQWDEALACGVFKGAPIDIADGYIHFSNADQVEETAAKHFHGQKDLLLVRLDGEKFGSELKWERSRGGALFPHLYGALSTNLTDAVFPLDDLPDGSHKFPETY